MINRNSNIFEIKNHFEKTRHIQSNCIFDNTNEHEFLITVVIPTFNRSLLLRDTINSAINQKEFSEYNVLVVDNNPERNDATEQLMQEYNYKNISYYKNEKNIGMFGNWNRCIELAKTPYIVFLHDDDLLMPDTLKNLFSLYKSVNKDEIGIIGRRCSINIKSEIVNKYNENGTHIKGLLKERQYYEVNRWQLYNLDLDNGCGALLKKECLIKLGGFNSDYFPQSDYILLLNYASHYNLYRINKIIRTERLIENESIKVYKIYAIGNLQMKKQILKQFFGANRLLYQLAKILYIIENYNICSFYGTSTNMKKPNRFYLFTNKCYYKIMNICNSQLTIGGEM